jgi:hypothetical protein
MTKKKKLHGKGTKQRAINGGLDDYYTNPAYATHCSRIVSTFKKPEIKNIIEPSAGNGSFCEGIGIIKGSNDWGVFMYDISPQTDFIEQMDFFATALPNDALVIGNPPFGFGANLAIKFFNHAAVFDVPIIAFILPRTFKKTSVKTKLNKNYHIVYEEDCPKNSFLLEGKPYDVPCVFQIWEHREEERVDEIWPTDNKWIEFTSQEDADFCIRRVGGRAGQVLDGSPKQYSVTSTYFCKEKIPGAKEAVRKIDFSDIINSTAGVRSLSKRELHKKLFEYYKEIDGSYTT